jgi:hypothetical protein
MKPLEHTVDLLNVAERVVWFKRPDETLHEPIHFLAYVMRYGTVEDLSALRDAGVGVDQYSEVLDKAPPGIFDARSWTYWTLKCGRTQVPPLPVRQFAV